MTDRKPRRRSIDQQWARFATIRFRGLDPTPTEVEDVRKAFFAGAFAVFSELVLIGVVSATSRENGEPQSQDRTLESRAYFRELIEIFDAEYGQHGSTN